MGERFSSHVTENPEKTGLIINNVMAIFENILLAIFAIQNFEMDSK